MRQSVSAVLFQEMFIICYNIHDKRRLRVPKNKIIEIQTVINTLDL